MPVQWVNRPDLDFRGFSGMIVGGTVRPGDRVRVAAVRAREHRRPGSSPTTATSTRRVAGQSVTLTLADEIDVSRGDVLAGADRAAARRRPVRGPHRLDGPSTRCCPGRRYLLKIGTRTVGATIAQPKYKVNVNTLEHVAAKTLELNEIGVCNLNLDRPIAFDPYAENRDMGGFILIDRLHQRHGRRRAAALRPAPGATTSTGRRSRSTRRPAPP